MTPIPNSTNKCINFMTSKLKPILTELNRDKKLDISQKKKKIADIFFRHLDGL